MGDDLALATISCSWRFCGEPEGRVPLHHQPMEMLTGWNEREMPFWKLSLQDLHIMGLVCPEGP